MSIVFLVQFFKGAGPGSWTTGGSAFCCVVIAGFALIRGEKSVTRGDWLAFISALCVIPVWFYTKSALWAVVLSTIIDFFAYIPTFRKSWHKPFEENFWLYFVDILKWIVAFFAMDRYSVTTLLYPIFLVISNLALMTMIVYRRISSSRVTAIWLFLFTLGAACLEAGTSYAQNNDALVYQISGVNIDLTDVSAAKARDQAILSAQREAFSKLLERLDLDTGLGDKLSSDDLAALVQNFEVTNERTSSVRYLGVFTIQFRPSAVKSYLASKGVKVADTRSKPVLVLPVYVASAGGAPLLWETGNRWRSAWDHGSNDEGLVPLVLPSSKTDEDAKLASTEDIVAGKSDPIRSLIQKYEAGGAVVVTLTGNPETPAAGLTVDMTRYDEDGTGRPVEHLTLPPTGDKAAADSILNQYINFTHHQIEKDWKHDQKVPVPPLISSVPHEETSPGEGQGGDPSVAAMLDAPVLHVPVVVSVATLSEWAQIRQRLTSTPGIVRVDVITLQRGQADIELEINSSVQDVQEALFKKHLQLTQDPSNNAWYLRSL